MSLEYSVHLLKYYHLLLFHRLRIRYGSDLDILRRNAAVGTALSIDHHFLTVYQISAGTLRGLADLRGIGKENYLGTAIVGLDGDAFIVFSDDLSRNKTAAVATPVESSATILTSLSSHSSSLSIKLAAIIPGIITQQSLLIQVAFFINCSAIKSSQARCDQDAGHDDFNFIAHILAPPHNFLQICFAE